MIPKKIFKVKFNSIDDVTQFVQKANLFYDDINITYEHMMVDGKSVDDIVAIGFYKTLTVELITDSLDALCDFDFVTKKWQVVE